MKKIFGFILAFCLILATINSCKKPYEDGPAISLRSKMNRITGKWRLVKMEGVTRLNPSVEQYMELTEEQTAYDGYKASFTNFQEEICLTDSIGNNFLIDSLFTTEGIWTFLGASESYYVCENGDYLYQEKQGIKIGASLGNNFFNSIWKIYRLTNKELVIKGMCYVQNDTDPCHLVVNPIRYAPVKLAFEKL